MENINNSSVSPDRLALRRILNSKRVQRWMDIDGLKDTSRAAIEEWMKEREGHRFLSLVRTSRVNKFGEQQATRGFVYAYGNNLNIEDKDKQEQEELKELQKIKEDWRSLEQKRRIAYMEKVAGEREEFKEMVRGLVDKKILPESVLKASVFEVSYAKDAAAAPGLIAPELVNLCEEIREKAGKDSVFLAFVDPNNLPSINALKAAGFEQVGSVKYEADSETEDLCYAKMNFAEHSFKQMEKERQKWEMREDRQK